jgi:hypothetical protein
MVKEKKLAKAVLAALKIEMALPQVTASALAAIYPDAVRAEKRVRRTRRSGLMYRPD